ncbi:MAG: restriction endonuclease subunit S [Alistipes sp.]|uniref:Restriction endonuclease subunit S n=1 Tax=Alistipes intestinihominis TaxID=3133172 RepID=A0ABV1GTP0_9BACT|nr:restriction endonuclease subunit S [Alistipes sp.]MBR2218999.1 restriction endonuclease subunit S [Alistipes sp.]
MKTNEKDTKQEVVPTLRFPEFSSRNWHIKELSKIANLIKERARNGSYTPMSVTSGIGLISQKEKFGRDISGNQYGNYFVIKKGDFAYNKSATNLYPEGYISMLKNLEIAAVPNSIFTCFKVNREEILPEYLNYLFEDNYHGKWLRKFIEVGARAHGSLSIDTKKLFELPIVFPSVIEQQKIADCLSSIDALIKATENKIDELKAHKKGLMQHLFPAEGKTVPEYRFPEFQDAGEWKPYRLNDFGSFFRGLTYSTADISNDNEGIGVLRSTNIQDNRLILDRDLVFVNKTCTAEQRLKKGDVVICMSNGSKTLVGKNAEFDQDISYDLTIGAFCSIFRPKNIFAKYLLQTDSYTKFISLAIGGGNINNLKNSDLENFIQFTPVKPKEQQKIADCLSSIDDLIVSQTKRLEALKIHKKGLMQQLFPNIKDTEA